MTQPFENAIAQIANVVSNVNGIKQAPPQPTEKFTEFPFASIYLTTGNLAVGPIGTRKSLYNIAIDVLTDRKSLPDDLVILHPFIDTIPEALLAEVSGNGNRFEQTISTFNDITIQFIPGVTYAEIDMIGYRFIMVDVKILVNTS
jgi:hypothetical protein